MHARYSIVDTDIHSTIAPGRVAEFLPQPWRWRYQSGNRGPGHPGYWNPNGVLRGNGVRTTRRVYWNNLSTTIASDIPSEARFQPANWGLWRFQ